MSESQNKTLSVKDAEQTMWFHAHGPQMVAATEQQADNMQHLLEYCVDLIDTIGEEHAYMDYLKATSRRIEDIKRNIDAFSFMTAWREWKKSRRVYQFADDVACAISKTKLDSIPTDVITHMPTNSMMLRIGTASARKKRGVNGTTLFDVMTVTVIPQNNSSDNRRYSLLLSSFIDNPHMEDIRRYMRRKSTRLPKAGSFINRYAIDLDKSKTMQDVFDDMQQHWEFCNPDTSQEQRNRVMNELKEDLALAINLVTYLTYSPNDIQYMPAPTKGSRRHRKSRSKEDKAVPGTYVVGETIVRDFIKQRTRYENTLRDNDKHGHHRTARPHVVSAYWRKQHYGPKNSLTKMIWVPSFMRCVNSDEDMEQIPLTVVNVNG